MLSVQQTQEGLHTQTNLIQQELQGTIQLNYFSCFQCR